MLVDSTTGMLRETRVHLKMATLAEAGIANAVALQDHPA
jgi:hypothetical protein